MSDALDTSSTPTEEKPEDLNKTPTNAEGYPQHDEETEKKSPVARRVDTGDIEAIGTQDPNISRLDTDVNDPGLQRNKDREFRDNIKKRENMEAEDIQPFTGAQLDEGLGTSFANATTDGATITRSPIGGVAIGLNNKDIVDPTADVRSRFDDVGPRPPIHRYDADSVDRPEDRDFFKGSRPETS